MEIQVFKLGFVGDVDLGQVIRLINSSRSVFRGVIGDSIRNIGDPDLFDAMGYSDGRLFGLFPPDQPDVIRVGIVLAPIQDNFYARSMFPGSVVLSLFQTAEMCEIYCFPCWSSWQWGIISGKCSRIKVSHFISVSFLIKPASTLRWTRSGGCLFV